jgi:hypothetical protein
MVAEGLDARQPGRVLMPAGLPNSRSISAQGGFEIRPPLWAKLEASNDLAI